MKKMLSLLLAAVMIMSIAACGEKTEETPGTQNVETEVTNEDAGESGEKADDGYEGITLKLSHNLSSVDILNTVLNDAADKIAERTNGKVQLEIYPNGELLTYAEAVEAIASDSAVIYYCSFGDWADFASDASALASGYVFESADQYQKFMETEAFSDVVQELADQNIYAVQAGWIGGFRHVLTNKKIDSLADLKGLSIRTPAVSTWVDCFEDLGMNVVGMAWTDTLTAVSQGSIDAAEATYGTITGYNCWDYFKYITETRHIIQAEALWMSYNVWQSIPEEYRTIVSEELSAAQQDYVKQSAEAEEEMRQQCIDHGMEINTDIDLNEFKEAAGDNVLQYDNGQKILDTLAGLN